MLFVDERQQLARSSPPHRTPAWSATFRCDEVGHDEGEQVLEVVEAHPGEVGQQASARRSNHGTDRYQPSSGEEGLGETSRSTTNEWEDEQKELKLSLNDPRDLKSLIIGLRTMLSGLRITRERVRMPWVDRAEISAANWCSI